MIARSEKPWRFRPRLVLAYADSARAALTSRQLRRQGWELHQAPNGSEVRRLVQCLAPHLVLLDTELPGESGWLTCAKLRLERPEQRVILMSANCTEERRRYSAFVGAAALVPFEVAAISFSDVLASAELAAPATPDSERVA